MVQCVLVPLGAARLLTAPTVICACSLASCSAPPLHAGFGLMNCPLLLMQVLTPRTASLSHATQALVSCRALHNICKSWPHAPPLLCTSYGTWPHAGPPHSCMQVLASRSGSLLLHPPTVAKVAQRLALWERLYRPGSSACEFLCAKGISAGGNSPGMECCGVNFSVPGRKQI